MALQPIGLSIIVVDNWPAQADPFETERLIHRSLLPLLDWVERYEFVRVSFFWSLAVHRCVLDDPDLVIRIDRLRKADKITFLGGSLVHGLLHNLPYEEALQHLIYCRRFLQEHYDTQPDVFYPFGLCWDPVLIGLLKQEGYEYALVSRQAMNVSGGWTERSGKKIAVVGVDQELSSLFPAGDPRSFFIRLQELAHAGDKQAVVVWPLTQLGYYLRSHEWCWKDNWLDKVARAMRQSGSWLKLHFPSYGRRHNSNSVYPQPGWPDPADLSNIQPWERSAYRFAEARGLQSMSVLLSQYVQQLKHMLRGQVNPGLLMCLEDIREDLYREQSVVSLSPYPYGALEDPMIRHEFWKLAEENLRKVEETLGERYTAKLKQQDVDCDGHDEVWVCTEWGRLKIVPHNGGHIQFLSLPGIGNLVNTLTRYEMNWHKKIPDDPSLPSLVGEEEIYRPTKKSDYPLQSPDFYRRINDDNYPRTLFTDHLFDRRLSLDNLQRGCPPECLPIVSHQLIRSEMIGNKVEVEMNASTQVQTNRGERSLAVQKRYTIHQDMPLIELLYTLHNRSLESIELKFGVELNINLDGKLTPNRYFVVEPNPVRGNFLRNGFRGQSDGARWKIDLMDINIQFWPPAASYFFPVETPIVKSDGLHLQFQGHCLVVVWDLSLWSDEKDEFGLSLSITKAKDD